MRDLTTIGVITLKDLRQAFRSGFFLVVGIATPLALAFVFNLVFGGVESARFSIPVGVIEGNRSAIEEPLMATLRQVENDELVELTMLPPGDAEQALDDHNLAVVIETVDESTVRLVADPDRTTTSGIVRALVTQVAQQTNFSTIEARAAGELGLPPDPEARLPSVQMTQSSTGASLSMATAMTASMGTLFLFIVAIVGVTSLLDERREGTLARIFAAPINRNTVIVAKTAVTTILGILATLVLIVASSVLMGTEWGAPGGVIILVVGLAAAATGLTLLVTGTARTSVAASNRQSMVAVVLALLGGALVPIPEGGILGTLSMLTPHHWYLSGLAELAEGAAVTAVLPAVGVLAVFALAMGLPGVALVVRSVQP